MLSQIKRSTVMSQNYHSPVTKQGLNTFDHIVNTAKILFGEKGYHSTSINKIIEKAGIATGTFYIYFKDKLSLYTYILNDYKVKIRETLHSATKNTKNRYQMEREGIKAFIKFAYQDTLSYNIIWESLFVDRDLFREYYQNFARSYTLGLKKSYEIEEIRETDFETLAYLLMGISNFVGLQIIFKKKENDPLDDDGLDKIVDTVMDILYNGMFRK